MLLYWQLQTRERARMLPSVGEELGLAGLGISCDDARSHVHSSVRDDMHCRRYLDLQQQAVISRLQMPNLTT